MYVDFKLEEEFSEEKNHAIIYSRTNRDQAGEYHNIGKSGNVIKMGSGKLTVVFATYARLAA